MQTRQLLGTDLELPILGFGASSLGQEFGQVELSDVFECVSTALECGLNFIDTSPYYGRGMSEVLLGLALRDVPRDSYTLCSKLGRYDGAHFDFSAKRVAESVDVSLHRLGTDHLDIMLCHDVEFVPLAQIHEETIPALEKIKQSGKVRHIGISGYPMKIFREISAHASLDCVLSYNQYTLQNTKLADELIPAMQPKGIGVMNAGPFAARLLTNAPLPPWHKASEDLRQAARRAADCCTEHGVDIAQLAIQFSCGNEQVATTIAGTDRPEYIRQWAEWISEPIDQALLTKVQAIFQDFHNQGHQEGLAENND